MSAKTGTGGESVPECEHPICTNTAYATVLVTDPNDHPETLNLCGIYRERMYENTIYDTESVEKLKKSREFW